MGATTVAPLEVEAERGAAGAHGVLVAEQDELGDAAAQQDVGGLEDAVVLALGQHDVAAVRSGPLHELELEHQRRAHLGRRHVDGPQQASAWSTRSEKRRRAVSILLRELAIIGPRTCDRGLRRVHRVGIGEGDGQVLPHAGDEPRDRLGHLVAAREDDAGELPGRCLTGGPA